MLDGPKSDSWEKPAIALGKVLAFWFGRFFFFSVLEELLGKELVL